MDYTPKETPKKKMNLEIKTFSDYQPTPSKLSRPKEIFYDTENRQNQKLFMSNESVYNCSYTKTHNESYDIDLIGQLNESNKSYPNLKKRNTISKTSVNKFLSPPDEQTIRKLKTADSIGKIHNHEDFSGDQKTVRTRKL